MCVMSLLCGPRADLWPLYGLYLYRETESDIESEIERKPFTTTGSPSSEYEHPRASALLRNIQNTVKPVLSWHRINRTPSIKPTVAEVPKFISLIFCKWNLY